MKVQCEICKADAYVESYICCTGSFIECGCEGKEQYEGIALCSKCLDILEHLDGYGYAIHTKPQDEKGHEFALTLEDVAEVE